MAQREGRSVSYGLRDTFLNLFFLLLGIALIFTAVADLLWTTFWADRGAGPVSSHLTSWTWRSMRAVIPRNRHRLLSISGPITLALILLAWVTLLWSGWTLVFAADAESVLGTHNKRPASWTGRIYFVGYTLFTLGNGDFSPKEGVWQIATSLAAGSGLSLLTLAVTYVLSILSAVVQKHSLATQVAGLGGCGEELLLHAWNGRDFSGLEFPLNTYSSQLSAVTEQHLAYPVLHYYHAAKAERSLPVSVAALDEALALLRYGVPENVRPNPAVLRVSRQAVQGFLDSLNTAFMRPDEETPPRPALSSLREAGIPTVNDEEFARALEGERERRRKLLGLVRDDAWEWPSAG